MDVAYSRVMLLGTAGVGKTCFRRSLKQEPWDPKSINSTILSDIDSIRPVSREWEGLGHKENERWSIVTEDDELEEMAQLLVAVHRGDISSIKSKVTATELFQVPSSFEASTEVPQESMLREREKQVQSVLARVIERARALEWTGSIKPQPFVNIWDCGGQPVFLEVLPAFLTSRTLFVLLYNASNSLNEKWKSVQTVRGEKKEEEEVNMTTLNLLLNWMANIHCHLAKNDEKGGLLNYPRILCIGTHGDKLKNRILRSDRKEAVKQELDLHCKGKPFEALIDGHYIIDNTTAGSKENEDLSFYEIRGIIRDFTSNKLIVETPITWVLFRKVIQSLKANVITVKEAQAIGVACKIPVQVVPKVLLYYHDIGVVLFYPHIIGLQDIVIISPQWFVNTLGKVLTLRGREEHRTRLMWDLLREKGILVQPLYVAAWREVEEIDPQALVNLLVHFRLAAEVKTDQYHDIDAKQYFLPIVLPSCSTPEAFVPSGYLQRATPLHLTFRTGFVPPGFFTRLITTIAAVTQCEIRFDKGVYRNKISFLYGHPPTDLVIIVELSYAIQVTILRYSPENDALLKFADVCQDLCSFLQQSAKDVDQCLFGSSVSKPEDTKLYKEFCFLCASPKCKSSTPHYLKHKIGQTCDLHLQCENNDHHRLVLDEEGYWFPKTKATKTKSSIDISENEMQQIAKKISHDKLPIIAAHFNMTSVLQTIQADQSKNKLTGFYLLYEWRQSAAGKRQELVKALEESDLLLLALMVKQSEYDPEKLREKNKLDSPVDLPPPPPSSGSQPISDNDLLRCCRHFTPENVTTLIEFLDDSLLNLKDVAQQYTGTHLRAYKVLKKWLEANPTTTKEELYEKLELTQVAKSFWQENKQTTRYQMIQEEDKHDGLGAISTDYSQVEGATYLIPSMHTTNPSVYNSTTTEMSRRNITVSTAELLDDNDLLSCSRHISKHISRLAGTLGISDKEQKNYKERYKDPNIRAYWILKDWLEVHPNTTKSDLKKKLKLLGFTKAAQMLSVDQETF